MPLGHVGVDEVANKGVLVLEDGRVVEVGLEADVAVRVEDDQVVTGDFASFPVGFGPLKLRWKTTSIKVSIESIITGRGRDGIRSTPFDNGSSTVIVDGFAHLSILSRGRGSSGHSGRGNRRRVSGHSGREDHTRKEESRKDSKELHN